MKTSEAESEPEWTAQGIPRFGLLLACMLIELMLAPLIGTGAAGLWAGRVATAIVLLAAIRAVGVNRATMALFVPPLGAILLASYSGAASIVTVSAALRLPFLCLVMALILRRVVREGSVTLDTIAAAACAYMLIGAVWADLYVLMEHWRPGSFGIPSGWMRGSDPRAALMFFSFSTLTTVTYGTMGPTDPAVGGLCVSEALVGQLFLAIMIARLVGLYIARRAS